MTATVTASVAANTASPTQTVAGQSVGGVTPATTPATTDLPDASDDGGTAPDSAAGANAPGTAAGASAPAVASGSRAGRGSGVGCAPRYAWVAVGTTRQNVFERVRVVAGDPAYHVEFHELDLKKLAAITDGTEWAGAATDDDKLAAFGNAFGRSIVDGGDLAKRAILNLMLIREPGSIELPEGIVLTYRDGAFDIANGDKLEVLVDNFINGIQEARIATRQGAGRTGFPIAGVEFTKTKPSSIGFFKHRGVATIDHLQAKNGELSLRRVLDGTRGHFGTKRSAGGGRVAPRETPNPLLCRPDASYVPGKLWRSVKSGVPGGGTSIGTMVLLALVSCFALLAITERRTRRLRRRRSS